MHAHSEVRSESFSDATAVDPRAVWAELVSGTRVVIEARSTTHERVFVTERRAHPTPLGARERAVLGRLALGQSRKEIGFVLGLARTSVADAIESAARTMGAPTSLDVVVLAAAFAAPGRRGQAHESVTAPGRVVLCAPLGESHLWGTFSPGEREVASLALCGLPAKVIASRRGARSQRTVANQLAQVFRKAAVSGRAELAVRLLAS